MMGQDLVLDNIFISYDEYKGCSYMLYEWENKNKINIYLPKNNFHIEIQLTPTERDNYQLYISNIQPEIIQSTIVRFNNDDVCETIENHEFYFLLTNGRFSNVSKLIISVSMTEMVSEASEDNDYIDHIFIRLKKHLSNKYKSLFAIDNKEIRTNFVNYSYK